MLEAVTRKGNMLENLRHNSICKTKLKSALVTDILTVSAAELKGHGKEIFTSLSFI